MQRSRKFAAIGSRNLGLVPQQGKDLFKAIASAYGKLGWICRTGAAAGADQLAAELTLEAGGSVELILPWPTYEQGRGAFTDSEFATPEVFAASAGGETPFNLLNARDF